MKRIFNLSILLFGVFSFFLISCEDDNILTVEPETNAIALDLDVSTIELDGTNPSNPGMTMTWTEASYTEPVAINYVIEFDIDPDFSAPAVVGTVISTNNLTWSVAELNAAVASAGTNPYEWTTVYARVKSNIGTQSGLEQVSNVVSFDIYPYFNYDYLDLFLVGPASSAGWSNNNNNPPMFRDPENGSLFSYTGYFNGDLLKLLEIKGQWAPQYGEAEQGKLAARPTEDVQDPNPIDDITTAGYYTFDVNSADLTFSITPATAGTAANSVGITGTGVSVDTDLSQLTSGGTLFDPHIWYIQSVHLVPGELNFVLNGSDNLGSTTSFSGTATSGGGNIPIIVEDDYDVWYNDITGEYIMIPLNL